MQLPRVELKGVSKAYGAHFALHRVSTTFEAGTLTLVLGPNGAGKSTMLSIIATLDDATSGELSYGDHGRAHMMKHGRGQVGWLSHDSLIYSELTVEENLRFYGSLYRLPDLDARVEQCLERVGMTYARARMTRNLSRGMRQRLSLARALLNSPRLLILDEPFTGLDRAGRAQIADVLRKSRDDGAIVLLSTHALDLDPSLVDRVLVLRRGKVRYDGPTKGSLASLYDEALT